MPGHRRLTANSRLRVALLIAIAATCCNSVRAQQGCATIQSLTGTLSIVGDGAGTVPEGIGHYAYTYTVHESLSGNFNYLGATSGPYASLDGTANLNLSAQTQPSDPTQSTSATQVGTTAATFSFTFNVDPTNCTYSFATFDLIDRPSTLSVLTETGSFGTISTPNVSYIFGPLFAPGNVGNVGFTVSNQPLPPTGNVISGSLQFMATTAGLASGLGNAFIFPPATWTITWNFSTGRSGCGDNRDQIIQEYANYNVVFYPGTTPQSSLPRCIDFTGQAHTSFYTFGDLDTGDNSHWAIIRSPIVNGSSAGYGLDAWVNHLGGGPARPLNSVYRNPAHNFSVGGAKRSRHMFGDAVDMRNISRTKKEYYTLAFNAALAQALKYGYIEPLSGPCKLGCVHADWRNAPGPFVNP